MPEISNRTYCESAMADVGKGVNVAEVDERLIDACGPRPICYSLPVGCRSARWLTFV